MRRGVVGEQLRGPGWVPDEMHLDACGATGAERDGGGGLVGQNVVEAITLALENPA